MKLLTKWILTYFAVLVLVVSFGLGLASLIDPRGPLGALNFVISMFTIMVTALWLLMAPPMVWTKMGTGFMMAQLRRYPGVNRFLNWLITENESRP